MEANTQLEEATIKKLKEPKWVWKKRTASISRWLHVYLSMLSFLVVLFFAVTGITLNHAEWFDGKQVEKKIKGKYIVRDLWRQKDLGTFEDEFSAEVKPHGVVMVRLRRAK